jgi:putative transposase
MPQSFTCLHFHLIFSTKNRMPLIGADVESRLYEYIGGVLRTNDGRLIAAGGMPDHVHLLASLSKEMAIAEAVRFVKSNSSKWIHETFPNMSTFAWQTGYAAFAVSFSNIDSVKEYIDN